MREAVFKIALAGLLHDIGKFAQRAATEGKRIQWDAKAEAEFKVAESLGQLSELREDAQQADQQ